MAAPQPVIVQPGMATAHYGPPATQLGQPAAPPQGQQGEPVWMQPPPQPPPNCPPGLEYLTMIDQLLVKQKVEVFEMFTGCEMKNKYIAQNSMGQQVFYIKEDVDCCTRQMCGPMRPFDMRVLDNYEREVMHFYRPFKCGPCSWCGGCCQQEIVIESPPGQVIGFVKQDPTFCIPKLTIYDADRTTPLIKIVGPCCPIACCADIEFQVLDLSEQNKIGSVTKQWTGFFREAFTDADNFGITFPLDLDVKAKASLMGALMLIDFMFFEQQKNNN